MDFEMMVRVHNEWMRRYTECLGAFEAEFQTVLKFLTETNDGKEPSYGESCVAYMRKLAEELGA